MNHSEDNKFNKEWEKAFKDASETPPPSIWQVLEKRLDDEQDKVIPLVWWKSPRIMYAAASVVIILMAGIGVWMNLESAEKVQVAIADGRSASESIAGDSDLAGDSNDETAIETGQVRSVDPDGSPETVVLEVNHGQAEQNRFFTDKENVNSKAIAAVHDNVTGADPSLITAPPVEENIGNPATKGDGLVPAAALADQVIPTNVSSSEAVLNGFEIASIENGDKSWVEKTARFNKRLVFYRPDIPEPGEEVEKLKKEYFAGAGVMPSMFNPHVSLASSSASTVIGFGKSAATRKEEMPTRSGASFAMQTYGGMKLNKHWSIETGISYLKGNSVFESKGYVMNVTNVTVSNVLETALATSNMKVADKLYGTHALQNSPSFQETGSAYYYLDVKENYQNNYSFLQLPVQAGYTIAPDQKLSYTVLGGVVGNLFLKNELNLTTGGTLVTSISDGTYQPLHWSASSGLRLNYRLAENWSAMLTGTYQKAFYDAGNQGAVVQFKPQLFGVGWGVRLNF